MNPHEVFIHIHQGCFAGTGAIVKLPQCQWSKPDGYGKISQCITTTKHSKAKTVCIFLGIYCTYPFSFPDAGLELLSPLVKMATGCSVTNNAVRNISRVDRSRIIHPRILVEIKRFTVCMYTPIGNWDLLFTTRICNKRRVTLTIYRHEVKYMHIHDAIGVCDFIPYVSFIFPYVILHLYLCFIQSPLWFSLMLLLLFCVNYITG